MLGLHSQQNQGCSSSGGSESSVLCVLRAGFFCKRPQFKNCGVKGNSPFICWIVFCCLLVVNCTQATTHSSCATLENPSIRLSVCLSVRPSVRPSVPLCVHACALQLHMHGLYPHNNRISKQSFERHTLVFIFCRSMYYILEFLLADPLDPVPRWYYNVQGQQAQSFVLQKVTVLRWVMEKLAWCWQWRQTSYFFFPEWLYLVLAVWNFNVMMFSLAL